MKKYLILYNFIFILFGNILLSNIHYLNNHNHLEEFDECIECINLDNNIYIIDDCSIILINNYFNLFDYEYCNFIIINIQNKYPSRAPPTF